MATPLPGAGLLRALQSDLPGERAETAQRIDALEVEITELREHLDKLDAILRAAEVNVEAARAIEWARPRPEDQQTYTKTGLEIA